MHKNPYRLLLALSVVLGGVSLVVVWLAVDPVQNIAATLAGSAIGLAASILIQDLASREQTEMIRAVTLDADGIAPLPENFNRLKWMAFATKKPAATNEKQVEWSFVKLTKVGGSGPRFVTYTMTVKNLLNDPVVYKGTFIGTQGCVICAITREHETSSSVTFDTTVSSAGVHFGVAYLTDWANERDVTLMVVGSSDLASNELSSLPPRAAAAFHRWFDKIEFDVKAAYEKFPIQK